MRNSGISLVLAITLLTAGAHVAPANCCAPKSSASQSVRAVDCCDPILDCPETPEAGLVAAVPSSSPIAAAMALPGDGTGALIPDRRVSKTASLETLPDWPPLYRLHAQLLI